MSGAARKKIEEALRLPEDDRAEIVGEFLVSLDGSGAALRPSSEVVGDRIARRLAEANSGSATPMSWDEAQRFIDFDEPDRQVASIRKQPWSSDRRGAGIGSAIGKQEKRLVWSTRPFKRGRPGVMSPRLNVPSTARSPRPAQDVFTARTRLEVGI